MQNQLSEGASKNGLKYLDSLKKLVFFCDFFIILNGTETDQLWVANCVFRKIHNMRQIRFLILYRVENFHA